MIERIRLVSYCFTTALLQLSDSPNGMTSPTPDVTESGDSPSYHDVIACNDPFGQLEMIDSVIFESETTIARDSSGEIVDAKRSGDIHPRLSYSAVTSNLNRRPAPELKRKGNHDDGVVHPLDALQSLNSKAEIFVRRQREEEVPLEPFVSNPFLMNVCHLRALLNNLSDAKD